MSTAVQTAEEVSLLDLVQQAQTRGDANSLRSANRELSRNVRENAALLGALWYTIWREKAWEKWGYKTFTEAIDEEAPRSYSLVWECVKNYRHYVVERKMTLATFVSVVVRKGVREVSKERIGRLVRQIKVLEEGETATLDEIGEIQWVSRHFKFSSDTAEVIDAAIEKAREMAEQGEVSDSQALGYICGDFISRNGVRKKR
jgi:hypothetical protein